MKNTDNVVDIRDYFNKKHALQPEIESDVESRTESAEDENVGIGFGIPACPCGQCVNHLIDTHGAVLISMDSLKDWFKGICPKAA